MAKQTDRLPIEIENEIRALRVKNRCYFHPRRSGARTKAIHIKRLVVRRVPLCEECWTDYLQG